MSTPLPAAVKAVIADTIYFRNKRTACEPQSDRPMYQFEIEEADEICAAVAPHWPQSPAPDAARLAAEIYALTKKVGGDHLYRAIEERLARHCCPTPPTP